MYIIQQFLTRLPRPFSGENEFLQQPMMVNNMKRMNMDPYLALYPKMNAKWIKDLNIRPRTIPPLEENLRVKTAS